MLICVEFWFGSAEEYPSEALQAELSTKLGLSDRQLQMWFCHRRLKDQKGPLGKWQPKDSPVGEEMVVGEVGNEFASGSGSASSPFVDSRRAVGRTGVAVARMGGDLAVMNRYYEPQQSIAELRAIAFVEAQLGGTLREDGPILGMEFDPLPPDAFGAPIGKFGFFFFVSLLICDCIFNCQHCGKNMIMICSF